MIPLTLGQIADAVGGRCEPRHRRVMVRRVVNDSRQVQPGDLFVAIRGERFDGHTFLREAQARGAAAGLRDSRCIGLDAHLADSLALAAVDDTVAALGRLAGWYRSEMIAPSTVVAAITGSNGKTTTKHLIDHILQGSLAGRAAPKSFNNAIGVPMTLLSVEGTDRYVVVEIGTNAPGEVAALARIASPDIAVITSIGEAHLAGLGDIHGVAAEKTSLLRYLRSDGLAVVNIDRPEIRPHLPANYRSVLVTVGLDSTADVVVSDVVSDSGSTRFVLDGRYPAEVPLPGVHHAANAAAAYVVARRFGLAPRDIVVRMADFSAVEGRGKVMNLAGVRVVDDSYNANPASMAAAITALRGWQGRRLLVMGDMRELGPAEAEHHQKLVAEAMRSGIDAVVAVGPTMRKAVESLAVSPGTGAEPTPQLIACEDASAAFDALGTLIRPGDTVWIKGSRATGLDRLIDGLRSKDPTAV